MAVFILELRKKFKVFIFGAFENMSGSQKGDTV